MQMKLHPRYRIVNKAQLELSEAFHEIWRKHELTTLEAYMIAMETGQPLLRYLLRTERHGDNPEDKKADEA
jgi:hypothetical protein